MDLIGTGAAAPIQSIIKLLKYDVMYDMMAPPKQKYASSAAERKIEKTKIESRSRDSGMCHVVIHCN